MWLLLQHISKWAVKTGDCDVIEKLDLLKKLGLRRGDDDREVLLQIYVHTRWITKT
jgi:hypothetical protein